MAALRPKISTAIDTFTFLLTDGGHIARVSEHVQVGGDVLVDDVTIEVSLLSLGTRARAPMPEEHYLSRTPSELGPPRSGVGVRLDRNHGVSYTGLHTRGLNQLSEPVELECVAEFEEIPPGMLRRTLVVSAICALVTLAFAFVMPSAVQDSRGTDFAAFLLAAPGFAATLVGISADRVQQSSLTTFGGLVVSGAISFTSSVLYVIQSLVWRDTPQVRLSLLGMLRLPTAETFWLLLAALSVITTCYLALESTHRMRLQGIIARSLRSGFIAAADADS